MITLQGTALSDGILTAGLIEFTDSDVDFVGVCEQATLNLVACADHSQISSAEAGVLIGGDVACSGVGHLYTIGGTGVVAGVATEALISTADPASLAITGGVSFCFLPFPIHRRLASYVVN